jgi:hypothetical protein
MQITHLSKLLHYNQPHFLIRFIFLRSNSVATSQVLITVSRLKRSVLVYQDGLSMSTE